jgi:APA family basic amino acid/polyamine antiporter
VAIRVRDVPVQKREIGYRRVLVPLVDAEESEEAISIASQLAVERGAEITAINVIELPAALPMNAHMLEEEARARRLLHEAQAIGELYGVNVLRRVGRAREAGEAIVEEARRSGAEIILLRARRRCLGRNRAIFGRTVQYVLRHSPCRVMVAAQPAGR